MRKTWKRHNKREVWQAIQNAMAQGHKFPIKAAAIDLNLTYERCRQVWHLFRTQITVVAKEG